MLGASNGSKKIIRVSRWFLSLSLAAFHKIMQNDSLGQNID